MQIFCSYLISHLIFRAVIEILVFFQKEVLINCLILLAMGQYKNREQLCVYL